MRGDAMAPTQFVKNARYDQMMAAFGGVGVVAKNPEELDRALKEAIASRKPTLINAIIDETAGTESMTVAQIRKRGEKARNPKRKPKHGGVEFVRLVKRRKRS